MTETANAAKRIVLRADALRNEGRILAGARDTFARQGFEASYHDIARVAGVGVATVYRRFPDRAALIEGVLLDILSELTAEAKAAAHAGGSAWASFEQFFRSLADRMHCHAGLSSSAGVPTNARVAAARGRLSDAVASLCRRAAPDLRPGIGWQDVLFLAQLTTASGCALGGEATDLRRELAVATILAGIRRHHES